MASLTTSTRLVSVQLVNSVLRRRKTLEEATSSNNLFASLGCRDRAFVWLLVTTCLRRLGQIDALIARCLRRPLPEEACRVNDLLRIGLVQILFVETPAYAAVNSMVSLATGELHRYRKLVNAVLRRVVREGASWTQSQDAAKIKTPAWLWKSWCTAYGDSLAHQISSAHLIEAPLDITPKVGPGPLLELLDATLLPTGTLRIKTRGPVSNRPGFGEGDWWVQDMAAGLPVLLFGNISNQRVIDLCAAPGGKTAQLVSRGADVTAVDRSPSRLNVLKKNLARLKLTANLVNADVKDWQPCLPSQYVLLDAPCTGTGTIRRHPDIVHLRGPEDVDRATAIQDSLLDSAVEMLAPGGILVFATCSLQPEEGIDRVSSLLARRCDLVRVPVTQSDHKCLDPFITADGDIRTLPIYMAEQGGMDGFYATRLRRSNKVDR